MYIDDAMLILFGLAIGVFITLFFWTVSDNAKEKERKRWLAEMEDALTGSDFCQMGCSYYENCHIRYKDSNIADDELYHNYCYICPVRMAIELIEGEKWNG